MQVDFQVPVIGGGAFWIVSHLGVEFRNEVPGIGFPESSITHQQ